MQGEGKGKEEGRVLKMKPEMRRKEKRRKGSKR